MKVCVLHCVEPQSRCVCCNVLYLKKDACAAMGCTCTCLGESIYLIVLYLKEGACVAMCYTLNKVHVL